MTSTAGQPRRSARAGTDHQRAGRQELEGRAGRDERARRPVAPGPLGHHLPCRPGRGPLLVVHLVVRVEDHGRRQPGQRGEGGGPRPDDDAAAGPGPGPVARAAGPPACPPAAGASPSGAATRAPAPARGPRPPRPPASRVRRRHERAGTGRSAGRQPDDRRPPVERLGDGPARGRARPTPVGSGAGQPAPGEGRLRTARGDEAVRRKEGQRPGPAPRRPAGQRRAPRAAGPSPGPRRVGLSATPGAGVDVVLDDHPAGHPAPGPRAIRTWVPTRTPLGQGARERV